MTSVRLTTALRAIIFALAATGASAAACAQDAARKINEMTAGKPAEVGVAWIADGKAHAVNNADGYPLMSVFKLHGAVAALRQMERRGTPTDTLITVRAAEMEKDTTPHKEQALKASRNVGNTAMRNTPKACEATTHNNVANRSGPMPLWQGKPNTP